MIIKTNTTIVDTDTYDCFYIEYSAYNREYRLLAVSKNTSETILLHSDENRKVVEKLLTIIYNYVDTINSQSRLDLGV